MKLNSIVKIPKVLGAGLASDDGFIIDAQFTVGYDAEKFGATAARVVSRIKKSLELERASAILYTQKSVFFIRETEDGIFFAICQKDANIGLIKIKIDKALKK
ncbi:hypothetical protein BXT86_02325 [candidate division WOR-3 bacterium 4484_100]|uniref:Roadblock/LAMTOR2 domain-containing protein n=1 Tax=candidate division WOR-3 bacterium 4484_100 TaxID=1936077 RepID=A0A1V4QFW6_UNCW3|nr:MAG: hypothetical protein BXT86_02325 [candidate division WOR-3 bacterium 4484_100]